MNELASIDWGLIAPLLILQVILMVIGLVDVLRREHTRGPKWMWVLIIIAASMLGPILYFIFGRGKNE